MKVVFVNPPIRLPEHFAHYPMASTLGLLSNAAHLRALGRDVSVVDAFTLGDHLELHDDGGGFRHVGADVDALARATRDTLGGSAADALVVVSVTMFSDLNRMDETLIEATVRALRARLPKAEIGLASLYICGMNYFPFDAARVLDRLPGADFVLTGEGEPTLPAIVERLERGEALDGLPQVASRTAEGARFCAAMPEPVRDLDALPMPAFDLLDMDRYFSVQADAIRAELVHEYHVVERQLPLMTSRGCPFRCNFCTNQVLALPWRAHSVERVVAMVRELRARYRIDRFLFLDDNINVNEKRFRELVRALAEVGVPWDAVNGYRADHLDREMVQSIKQAGNTKITVSAESGDPKLLEDVIGKRLELPTVVRLAKLCAEERMPLQVHYIVGVPGETKEQINKTLEFSTVLLEKHGAWPLLQHAIPFPGTALYRTCEEKGFFVATPSDVPGSLLEVQSIIRTPDFEPEEVFRMKRNAQHLHASIRALAMIEVESRCSNRCLACHCTAGGDGSSGQTPSREDIRAALERARFFGAREAFLGGGEPSLREDLAEIVREARELGFERVALLSNAHGFTREAWAAGVLAERIDRVVLDLQGPDPSIHDRVANRQGSFAGTLAGLRRLRAHGGVLVEVSVAVTRLGMAALPATVLRARKLGAESVHLQIPAPDGRAAAQDQIPTWEEALPYLERALDAWPGKVSIQGAPLCLLPERRGAISPLPPWALRRTRNLKARHPECQRCLGFILCGGFYRSEHEDRYRMREQSAAPAG